MRFLQTHQMLATVAHGVAELDRLVRVRDLPEPATVNVRVDSTGPRITVQWVDPEVVKRASRLLGIPDPHVEQQGQPSYDVVKSEGMIDVEDGRCAVTLFAVPNLDRLLR